MNVRFIYDFLKELAIHNNREWFNTHKSDFQQAEAEFENLLTAIIARIAFFDSSVAHLEAKDCTYRIYRDLRFTQDKTPYKIHFGGFINARGKKALHCGYYVHLQPGESLLAGGAWCPEPKLLKAIRESIYDNIDEYRSIVEDSAFKKYFNSVGFNQLITAPKGFPKDFPYMEYLKPKDFSFCCYKPDSFFIGESFLDKSEDIFKQMKRLNDFFDYTLSDFED
ncbi:MAG: DUF2461 domain-containing protein [Phocaeicola sp.]|uniref:DUF2461 domain-containing protein n=1 Tax=Phocaeicola TaxID=909656 RepID=UPI00234E77CF|nr:DUF2461 domain-containing protein [Phocaeicola oris]MCE2617406.1 DUF2461 domain-containing protein [Phocaeicola oris]